MPSEQQLSKLIGELLKEESKENNKPVGKTKEERLDHQIHNEVDDITPSLKRAYQHTDRHSQGELPSGQVWVKNNEVMVEAQPGKHSLPSIRPTKGVELFVNGELVKNETLLSNEDYLQLNLKSFETPLKFQINISNDRLKATMSVKLKTINQYYLKDHEPCKDLVLKTEVESEKLFPLNVEEILEALNEKGVSVGVDYVTIQNFLTDPRDGEFIVARGIPPKDPVDDSVTILFEESIKTKSLTEEKPIDFYNLKQIPSVEKGALLAVTKEGKPGQPGLSVNGETLTPRDPKHIIVKAGKGVRQDTNAIYATKAGRPMVRIVGTTRLFFIEPHLIQYGDIDISVGNQSFRGNITVYGNVCDNMAVQSGGDIQVYGYITRANVIALKSVKASKCFGSRVQAGGESYYIDNCCAILIELLEILHELSPSVNEILKYPQLQQYQNKLGLLILLIIEKKFPGTPKLLKSAVELLEITPIEIPEEIVTLVNMIKENLPPRNLTLQKIKTLIEHLEFARDFFEEMRSMSADMNIGYAANSIISATGNVHISGQGCFSSTISAGGDVRIANLIRGGEVKAKGEILVREVGSETGTKTKLKTQVDQKIRILSKVYDGTILNVGGLTYEVVETMGPSQIYNESGKLKVRSI